MDRPAGPASDLIGAHESIVHTRRLIARVAASATRTVLIYGETGTGKGLAARMLHEQSARAAGAFVDVNCAAIPANLMESELFGYERGAFTGALAKKTGLIEAADKGTLFLDEIRELDPPLQAKLLTLLDTQRFRRVGAVRANAVDVRFIAATNRILFGEVGRGRFREDLYYRLQVVAINLPPLRERGDDVFVLTDHFLARFAAIHGRVVRGLEPAVEDVFRAHAWPGNVRELQNLLERFVILEDDDRMRVHHVPPRILREVTGVARGGPAPAHGAGALANPISDEGLPFKAATEAFQRRLIENAFAREGASIAGAARRLGLSRHALRHHMAKLGISARDA